MISVVARGGERGILNQITVPPATSAADVKPRIQTAFKRTAEIDTQKLKVETHNGQVTLKENVGSWAERREAIRTA